MQCSYVARLFKARYVVQTNREITYDTCREVRCDLGANVVCTHMWECPGDEEVYSKFPAHGNLANI